MLKALKLNGGHTFSFAAGPRGIVDLSKPLHPSFTQMDWHDLQGKTIYNKNVVLSRYGDIHGFPEGPVFKCENLVLDQCDKNFLCYWLHKQTFPNVKQIFIGSHPCDHYVLPRNFQEIHLHERFKRYKDRWWSHLDNIKTIFDSDYNKILESYDNEEILYEKSSL